jgi:ribonucleoside-diphosphate reductase alpha chain
LRLEEWLENNELSIDIWHKKYQYNNETLDEWLDRVSGGNSQVRELIEQKKFIFGGRINANRGVPIHNLTYRNCFALDQPEDSIEGIYETARKTARIFSYGGGVGINISSLAPRGAKVRNAAKTTTGAVSFVELFDKTASLICQNGRRKIA